MTEIEAYDPGAAAMRGLSLPEKLQYAGVLAKSGLIPKIYQGNDANALVAIEYGTVLDIHPLSAMNLIHVIEGKPTQAAELMRSSTMRAGHKFRIIERSSERATVQIVRADDPEYPVTVTYTIADAIRAGLRDRHFQKWGNSSGGKSFLEDEWFVADDGPERITAQYLVDAGAPEWVLKQGPMKMKKKDNWWKDPTAMLFARATSGAVRAICPEVLMGVSYTAEELGAAVDEDGHVLDVAEAARLPLTAEHQVLVDRFNGLLEENQTKLLGYLRGQARDPKLTIADFPDGWHQRIAELLDKAEDLEASITVAEIVDDDVVDPGEVAMLDGDEDLGGDDRSAASAADPVTGPDDGSIVAGAAVEDPTAQGPAPRDVAMGGDVAPPAASPPAPAPRPKPGPKPGPVEKPVPQTAAQRAMLHSLLGKAFPPPPEVEDTGDARDGHLKKILVGLCSALGVEIESRTEITKDLAGKAIDALEQIKAGKIVLEITGDGAVLRVANTGEVAA